MMLSLWNGVGSLVLRCIVRDSTLTNNGGKTGLAYNTSGLIISTIADNESSATAYTQAGGTIETIATLGTFATPTATKCRFKEVDGTLCPGLYEIQIANARWAVSGARYVVLVISGVTGATQEPYLIQLPSVNLADATNSAAPAVPNAAAGAVGGLPLSFRAGGYVGLDWANVANPTATVALSNTTISSTQNVAGCGSVSAAVSVNPWDSQNVTTGTASAGGASTITIASGLGADDIIKGCRIKIYSGTGANQTRVVTAYNNTTGQATVDRPWVVNPNNTSVYAVMSTSDAKLDASLAIQGVLSVTNPVDLTSGYDFAKGTAAMTESYAADGAAFTPSQALFMIWSLLAERSVSSTTLTAKKLDGTTSAMTFTLNSSTAPTSQTRAT